MSADKRVGHRFKTNGRSRYRKGLRLHDREPFTRKVKRKQRQRDAGRMRLVPVAPAVTLADIWPTDDS